MPLIIVSTDVAGRFSSICREDSKSGFCQLRKVAAERLRAANESDPATGARPLNESVEAGTFRRRIGVARALWGDLLRKVRSSGYAMLTPAKRGDKRRDRHSFDPVIPGVQFAH